MIKIEKVRKDSRMYRTLENKAKTNEMPQLPIYLLSLQTQVDRMSRIVEEMDQRMRELDREYIAVLKDAIEKMNEATDLIKDDDVKLKEALDTVNEMQELVKMLSEDKKGEDDSSETEADGRGETEESQEPVL